MSRLGKHIEHNVDNYSVGSKKKLKAQVEHRMKRIFVGILDLLDREHVSGNINEETFKSLRSQVLNIGNDQVRNIRKELDERYNVEFIAYHIVLPVIPIHENPNIQLGRGRV